MALSGPKDIPTYGHSINNLIITSGRGNARFREKDFSQRSSFDNQKHSFKSCQFSNTETGTATSRNEIDDESLKLFYRGPFPECPAIINPVIVWYKQAD